MFDKLTDTLIRMDGNFTPQPYLAESWEISEDGLEWTFKIREGVKFHNGAELTVEDVHFSLERGLAYPKASPSYTYVASSEIVDDQHVKVTLKSPYGQVLANLALPFGPIMNKEYVESMTEEEFGRAPMGTGPYKFVEWVEGESVTMEANEDYFLGAPAIKEVKYVTIADTSAALLNLESGDIDAYCDITPADYALAQANPEIKINEGPAIGYEFIQFNTAKAPFDDVRVRQAIAHAVNKEALLMGINEGIGTQIETFVLEDAIGYTEDITTYDYNLEEAKRLLAEAGYADGLEIDIHAPSDIYSKYAQVIQASLYEIGVTANIKLEEVSAYKASTAAGNYDMAVNGCSFVVMDVYESVAESVLSENIGTTNTTFYDNARVSELLNQAIYTTDEAELETMYNEVLITLSEEVPMIPFIWRVRNITAHEDLHIPYMDPYAFHFLHEWSWN